MNNVIYIFVVGVTSLALQTVQTVQGKLINWSATLLYGKGGDDTLLLPGADIQKWLWCHHLVGGPGRTREGQSARPLTLVETPRSLAHETGL